jgi:hypothetical protein
VKDLAHNLGDWLGSHGYDPLLIVGLISAVLLILDRKNIRNLRNLPPHLKRFTIAQVVVGGLLALLGILSVVGVLPPH